MTETNPPADPDSVAPEPHHTAADDQVTYYEGSPRLRGELGVLFLWTLAGLLIAGIPIALRYSDTIQNNWVVAIAIIIAFIIWLMPSLLVRRNHYRVTNYRIDYEHGILFKDLDTLELWHVEDVSLHQSPFDRIFNVGTITVVSGDATTPRLELKSVDNPRKLLETLKTRIIAVKRQRGVIKMDLG